MLVSFIIPAYNEELLLPRTIRSIHAACAAAGIRYEIVVADDASDDATPTIAGSLGAVVVRVEKRQIAATRNAGARRSRGEMLVFVDADTVVTPGAVRGAVRAVRRGAAYGGAAIRWDGRIPAWSGLLLRVMLMIYPLVGQASGAFLFCTRAAFDAAGGFDEALYASEECRLSLALRRRGRFAWVRSPVITSGRKLRAYTLSEMMGALVRIGVGGRGALRRREGLEIWYGPRRTDPDRVVDITAGQGRSRFAGPYGRE